MILNLLRRQLDQAGIALSMVEMMKQLTNIQAVTVLYPGPPRRQYALAGIARSKMNVRQQEIFATLGLEGYHNWMPRNN